MDNICVKYHPDPSYLWKVIVRKHIFALYSKFWPWPWRYDTESRSWYNCVIYYQDSTWTWGVMSQIQFLVCVHFDLDLGAMTLGQGQQLCEILSISNLAVRSYGPDTDFGYVCTLTLTFKIWSWVKVMTHPWVTDNNCLEYYPDQTWQWVVMARTGILGMCVLWPWPLRYDLGSRSLHTLG